MKIFLTKNVGNCYKHLPNKSNKGYALVSYRVSHTYLTKVILLEMTLNCTAYLKSMHFCNHKDPPFDMKCQLMSADPLPAVKIDLKYIS